MNLLQLKQRVAFIDVEASGLMPGSFPVDVAWWTLEGEASHLVRPDEGWDRRCWDPVAEKIHGYSQVDLNRRGRPAPAVAQMLSRALMRKIVFTDAPEQDSHWLAMIHATGSSTMDYRVLSIGYLQNRLGLQASEAYDIFKEIRSIRSCQGRAKEGVDFLKSVFQLSLQRVQNR